MRMGTATSELTRRRKANRLTQEQLAVKAGLTARTIREIEKGRVEPLFSTQEAIAQALACHPDDIFPTGERVAA